MCSVCDGAVLPALTANEKAVGARPTDGAALVSAVADTGESAETPPVVYCAASASSVVDGAVSAGAPCPAAPSLNDNVPPPGGTSTAIQYVAPQLTAAGGTTTLFHATATGAVSVP